MYYAIVANWVIIAFIIFLNEKLHDAEAAQTEHWIQLYYILD